MMECNICKERYLLRQHYGPHDDNVRERRIELERLWKELPVEKIEIHHSLYDYVTDCPALSGHRKLWPTTYVYYDAGCTGCEYYDSIGLRHVLCKWSAVHPDSDS